MKRKVTSLFALLMISAIELSAQYAKWNDSSLTLNNGIINRVIKLPANDGKFYTKSYAPVSGAFEYFEPICPEFQFEVGGTVYSGRNGWTLSGISTLKDERKGQGAAVTLRSQDQKIEITVKYLLYPQLPVVRKSLIVKNLGNAEAPLESIDVEKFAISGYDPVTYSWILSDYGRRRSIGPYEGNPQDALVIVHNMDWKSGIVIGNEATGVLKRTALFWNERGISAGLTHKDGRYPFRKWLKPGDSFETPQIFTMVYNNHKAPEEVLNTYIPDFIRRHMGIRLSELKEKPTYVYNTWEPFQKDINEKLVREVAKAAADAGMKEFIIDDGWQKNYGDWEIDKDKFPNGLKPIFDYIKSLGMKPGLWVSLGAMDVNSKVYKEHPEWVIQDENGTPANLHVDIREYGANERSACMSTEWNDNIKKVLLKQINEYGLEYLKLDFAVVTSAYRFGNQFSGCYAKNHPSHKDHAESLYANYEAMWQLFDELHAAKRELFIDCTFEATGGLQLIDYAMLKHAEGNWLSNYEGDAGEKTDLRIRQMAWWRSPAIPATALVIGNPEMQDKNWEGHIKSIAGALPIMLGDPRKLKGEDFKRYRLYADWLQSMEKRHQIMSFRQDLEGFGEPREGHWDGFQRINTESKSGGIVAVFRHGAVEESRVVTVQQLDLAKMYKVKTLDGKVVSTMTGKALRTTGFKIRIDKFYGGEFFEVSQN
ncbi:MAG TPA: alpha-galactosidase [Pedobacter sp.]